MSSLGGEAVKANQQARWLLRLAAAAGVVGTVAAIPVILNQASSQSWAGEPAEQAPAQKPASVRVEHEFVTLDPDPEPAPDVAPSPSAATSQPTAPTAYRTTAPTAYRTTASPPTARTLLKQPEPTLTQKTRRALLGDGRHRPEPFPRVR